MNSPESPEVAREVVLKRIGDRVGTVGPFTRKDKKELASLSAPDRATATALLDRGALGFLICSPDNGTAPGASNGPLADMVKVDRIIFVQNAQIVGDFPAVK
jgi:hypothetical protein